MRISQLDVVAFGPLTNRSLVFRPDAKLHLVYGPNEAGKSTVLHAIEDLLFGFPQRVRHDRKYDPTLQRLGATLRNASGASLSFRRRRGTKNTLLSADGAETPLNDDALAPFIGTLSREMFERSFGLDSHRLRSGAAAMLEVGGEAASSLFAAASGLSGLTGLRANLEAEASTLFAPRASKDRRFYQVLERHEDARQRERASELKASDWKALLVEIESHEAKLAELRDQHAELRREGNRLQRLRQLQPILADIDADLHGLAAHADLEPLPAGLSETLAAAIAADEGARRAVAEATAAVETAGQNLRGLVLDAEIHSAAGAINNLFARSQDYQSKRRDLPRIRAEQEDFLAKLHQLARRLGLSAADELPARYPSDAALAELRVLITSGLALRTRHANVEADLAREQEALSDLDRDQSRALLIDTGAFSARFLALEDDLQVIAQLEQLRPDSQTRQRRLAEQTSQLLPPVPDLDRLAGVPLPTAAEVVRHREALQAASTAGASADSQLAATEAELFDIAAAIAADEAGQPVPSRAAIAEARAARDAALATIRSGFDTGVSPTAAALGELAALIAAADRLADAAASEADRVLRHEANQRRRAVLLSEAENRRAACTIAEAARAAAEADYARLFAPAGIVPLTPDRMVSWLGQVADLLDERRELLALGDRIAAITAMAETLRVPLLDIAAGIGSTGGDRLPIAALARLVEDRLEKLATQWSASLTQAGQRQALQHRVDRLAEELTSCASDQADWAEQFARAAMEMGLPPNSTIDGASAAIEVWEQLPALQAEHDNRAGRVAGMRRDIEGFEHDLAALVASIAPDLAGQDAADTVVELHRRLEDTQRIAARRDAASTQIGELELKLARATQAATEAAARLAQITADIPEHLDLPTLVVRLRHRDELTDSLANSRKLFRDTAEGLDEATLRAELQGFDRDTAVAEVAALTEAEARVTEEINEHYALLKQANARRDALEAGGGVELAVFEKHAAEAEIVDVARQWVTLKLAASLLGSAMDRHRRANADPMVDRAGELLTALTGGSLAGLAQDYGDDDVPRLVGLRPSGETVGVNAMSEGTRDQLYLALRLAYLEDFARHNEAAPFIGDDIFQTFDDQRTQAGLRVLAATAGSVQPILFTHHRSVVDAGLAALGADLDLIAW
jgi:uncharacterized protein YhaN